MLHLKTDRFHCTHGILKGDSSMVNLYSSMTKKEILERVGDISQICDARRQVYVDGKSGGVETIDVKTGSGFEFTVG